MLICKTPSLHRLRKTLGAWTAQLLQVFTCKPKTADPEVDSCKEAFKEAQARKTDLVYMYTVLLILIAFGPLCPLLFLTAPIYAWSNLSAISWLRSQAKRERYLQHMIDKAEVQHPISLFSLSAVFGQLCVVSSVFVDLQFSMGPIILYVVFCGIHLAVVSCYYLQQSEHDDSAKQTTDCMFRPRSGCIVSRQERRAVGQLAICANQTQDTEMRVFECPFASGNVVTRPTWVKNKLQVYDVTCTDVDSNENAL